MKKNQYEQKMMVYSGRDDDENFEIDRPHNSNNFYNFLISYKFNNALKEVPFSMSDLSVLDICCGSGMISEYYARRGARVTGIDLSEEAIERAKIRRERYEFEAEFRVANTTGLPFQDNTFDVVSVHDGLHHLKDPEKAVKEMVRVARKGVIIIEPARALITRISVFFGVSTDYEGKDYVYRFRKGELKRWLREAGIEQIGVRRYIMYYPHKPGEIFQVSGIPVLFQLVKMVFYLLNVFFRRCGNKIQVIGLK